MRLRLALVVLAGPLLQGADKPDVSTLSDHERATYQSVTSEEFCGCSSPLTIAGCLQLRPDCMVARHLGNYVLRSVKQGHTSDEILGDLSKNLLASMCHPVKNLELNDAPAVGPANAPVTVIEFADFRCAHCKQVAPDVKAALAKYGNKTRFVFMPFPLQNHPMSVAAAEAALAANAQGKFAEMSQALFAYEGVDYDDAVLLDIAKRAGLDLKRFTKDMSTHVYRDRVLALKARGTTAGIEATPTFFVNGRKFSPSPPELTVADRLAIELDRNKGTCQ